MTPDAFNLDEIATMKLAAKTVSRRNTPSLRHPLAITMAAFAISLVGASARADVRYDFTAVSAYPVNHQYVTGSFSAIVSDFILTETHLPASSLLSCSQTTNDGTAVTCLDQWFTPNTKNRDAVGFGMATALFANRHENFYFQAGAFSAYGNYSTIDFGADQFATLTVSQVTAAVPEPSTWVSLFAGLGITGAALLRKKSRAG